MPLQEASILPITGGQNAIMLAPTAGGKTEAAFLPVLSRMLTENWSGLSVLYICPIKALLNNLETRLSNYSHLVGRRCALWHGDIKTSPKAKILTDTPDCLLTTPESLEVMLISRRVDKSHLFGSLKAVIVDEVHAFAGDDRGWHLISILERLTKLAGRELQRIGLSATVGNPEELLEWLTGQPGTGQVIAPATSGAQAADVQLDYIGNLQNAAIVISRLHCGEKRLVFCDSRARVEELASNLRGLGVETYVSHSSLSLDQRRQAETAFSTGNNCVIVATSTLELGIDVGDLDRVIQIDAPNTVSSFLQRMGRTGRRASSERNCLFLATSRNALVRAAGLINLWEDTYVEPVVPPPAPFHIFAQQLMALALQSGGFGVDGWQEWIGRMPPRASMTDHQTSAILKYMIGTKILWNDEGVVWLGKEGEGAFGRRNFLELFSVFNSPPMFTVRHGQSDIGQVDVLSFLLGRNERIVLSLGGRSWLVTHLAWDKKVAYVRPTEQRGKSRWSGASQALSYELCQVIRRTLGSEDYPACWSSRACDEIGAARIESDWISLQKTSAVISGGNLTWWTFGGLRANSALAEHVQEMTDVRVTFDNLSIELEPFITHDNFAVIIEGVRRTPPVLGPRKHLENAINGLKFSVCLPPGFAEEMLRLRTADSPAVEAVLSEGIRHITM